MTHAAAAGPAEGETGRRLTRGQRIEMPNDGRRRLAIQRHGLSSTWVLREAKDSAEGDRAQHRHGASTGSFHLLLLQLLSGNPSAPTPGGQDDRSRPRAAGRRCVAGSTASEWARDGARLAQGPRVALDLIAH